MSHEIMRLKKEKEEQDVLIATLKEEVRHGLPALDSQSSSV